MEQINKALRAVRVVDNMPIGERYKLLRLEKSQNFIAGQVVSLAVAAQGQSRMYSIASGQNDSTIDILYSLQPEGFLTPQLWNLSEQNTVFCSAAFGNFRQSAKPQVWIATGTGIAPFVAMLRSGDHTNTTLIHGVRAADDLYNHDQFLSTLKDRYLPCISTQHHKKNAFSGRVTDFLAQSSVDTTKHYLLCGKAEMVVEVRDFLLMQGVPFTQIAAEIYF